MENDYEDRRMGAVRSRMVIKRGGSVTVEPPKSATPKPPPTKPDVKKEKTDGVD